MGFEVKSLATVGDSNGCEREEHRLTAHLCLLGSARIRDWVLGIGDGGF